jgi:hypothetical protein
VRVPPQELRLLPVSFPYCGVVIDYSPNLETVEAIVAGSDTKEK